MVTELFTKSLFFTHSLQKQEYEDKIREELLLKNETIQRLQQKLVSLESTGGQ